MEVLNRRQFLSLTGAAAVALDHSAAIGSRREPANRPNILFCISDDQTWLHCSAYGSKMVAYYFDLAFGKRPAEELYDVKKDPYQLQNLVDQDQYANVRADLAEGLRKDLVQTKDPRALGRGDELDSYARKYQKSLGYTLQGSKFPRAKP